MPRRPTTLVQYPFRIAPDAPELSEEIAEKLNELLAPLGRRYKPGEAAGVALRYFKRLLDEGDVTAAKLLGIDE